MNYLTDRSLKFIAVGLQLKDEAAKEHSEANWQYIFGAMKKMVENREVK